MLSPHWIGHLIALGSIIALCVALWLTQARVDRCLGAVKAAPAIAQVARVERERLRVERKQEAEVAAAALSAALASAPAWADQEVPQDVRDALR